MLLDDAARQFQSVLVKFESWEEGQFVQNYSLALKSVLQNNDVTVIKSSSSVLNDVRSFIILLQLSQVKVNTWIPLSSAVGLMGSLQIAQLCNESTMHPKAISIVYVKDQHTQCSSINTFVIEKSAHDIENITLYTLWGMSDVKRQRLYKYDKSICHHGPWPMERKDRDSNYVSSELLSWRDAQEMCNRTKDDQNEYFEGVLPSIYTKRNLQDLLCSVRVLQQKPFEGIFVKYTTSTQVKE